MSLCVSVCVCVCASLQIIHFNVLCMYVCAWLGSCVHVLAADHIFIECENPVIILACRIFLFT